MTFARKLILSLILAAILLAAVIYLVGARQTLQAAREVPLPAFLLVGVVFFGLMACQAAAWSALERPLGHRVPYPSLLAGTIVAMAGNVLTPSTHLGGEPGKIIYVGRKTGLSYTDLTGTVLLSKYIEAMSFVLFLAFGAGWAVAGHRATLFSPHHIVLGVAVVALTASAIGLAMLVWLGLRRKWTPLSAVVAGLGRLGFRQAFFADLHERCLRVELQAARLFREEGHAVLPAFGWYLLTHVAMFVRPYLFFHLAWGVRLDLADLGLIFLTSQILLAVQLTPSGVGTLDGGLLGVISLSGIPISSPQCVAFLLCVRFWDAAVVALGALLAARAGVGLFRRQAKETGGGFSER
ncbi:MAG: lysylphosphatidylglycerol synthase transmembrane domain-containing protein [Planctomycetota bacterium]|nr:lysylphosphatidylglycerol synthase transmembrane domain-containing protein [Planctomycetota bacterium]